MTTALEIMFFSSAVGFFTGFGAVFGAVAAGRWLALKNFFTDETP